MIILINTVSYDSLVERIILKNTIATFMPLMYLLTAISIVGGIFGIVGGMLVGRNNVLAGIFMAIGAAASFTNNGVSLAASIMLILGAVFAFLRVKKQETQRDVTVPPSDTLQQ